MWFGVGRVWWLEFSFGMLDSSECGLRASECLGVGGSADVSGWADVISGCLAGGFFLSVSLGEQSVCRLGSWGRVFRSLGVFFTSWLLRSLLLSIAYFWMFHG